MIAHRDRGNPLADRFYNATALVAQNGGKHALGVFAAERKRVGVTNAASDDFDTDFARFRRRYFDFFNLKRFACGPGDGGTTGDRVGVDEEGSLGVSWGSENSCAIVVDDKGLRKA